MLATPTAAGPALHAVQVLPQALGWVVVLSALAWIVHRRLRAAADRARHRAGPWLQQRRGAPPVRVLRWARRVAAGPVGAACRSVLVTGVAAAIGWTVASGSGLSGPETAAISATLSVQLSVHSSLKEGTQRIAATLAGFLIAIGVWKTAGVHTWSIALIAAASLAVGRFMRLGEGAIAVPATSLGVLVVGSTMTDGVVLERMAATIVGVVIGAALSPFASGTGALERAQHRLGAVAAAIADLLAQLGDGTSRDYGAAEAAGWLTRIRELGVDLDAAAAAVADLSGQARWSPWTPVAQVDPMHATVRVLRHSLDQVASIARSLLDATAGPAPEPVRGQFGPVLHAAAGAFAAHARVLTSDTGADRLAAPIEDLRQARRQTARALRAGTADTGTWLFAGSILTDLDRMAGTLDRSAPVLGVDVPTAPVLEVPAVSRVLPAVRAATATARRRHHRRVVARRPDAPASS